MISLENVMRFGGGARDETGSGYESESSLAESSAAGADAICPGRNAVVLRAVSGSGPA